MAVRKVSSQDSRVFASRMAVLRAFACVSICPVAVQAFARTSSIAIRGYRPFATARPSDFDAVVDRAAAVAETAARLAGKEIVAGMGAAVKKQKMNFKDIVTGQHTRPS